MRPPREGDIDRDIIPRAVDARVDEELAFHIAMRTRDLIARGVAPADAEEQARAAFGDVGSVREELTRIGRASDSAARRIRFVAEAVQDVRFAWRMLRRRRSAALLMVGVLALGIGAATAIFSLVDGVLLRPLPFPEPDRLAAVWIGQPSLADNPVLKSLAETTPIGNEEYRAIRSSTRAFSAIGLFGMGALTLETENGAEPVAVGSATQSVFELLRIAPMLGRTFTMGEDALGGPNVGLLSYEAWRGRYGGDSAMIGRTVMLNRTPYTIIGVMPEGFRLDRTVDPPFLWMPALRDSSDLPERHNRNYLAVARLAPGATFAGASLQATPALREITGDTTINARVMMWQQDQSRAASRPVLLLLAAAGLLLLIACVNVALLQLGEVGARRGEIGVRVALGAGPGRLMRQLLAESMLLSLMACTLGTALAWAMLRGLLAIAPERLPGLDTVHIDARVLGFAVIVAVVTGLAFGIVPAWLVGQSGIANAMREGNGQSARGAAFLQRTLLAAQIAMSMVLLVMSVLLGHSLYRLSAVDPGFRAEQMMAVRISMPWTYEGDRVRDIIQRTERRLSALPGVRGVTVTSSPPFIGGTSSSPVQLDDAIAGGRTPQHTMQLYVATNYFEQMGIRLLAGRTFRPDDGYGASPVAVINEAMIRRDFGTIPVLGQRVRHQGVWRTIVGVVSNVHAKSLSIDDGAGIYVPIEQHPSTAPTFLLRAPEVALHQPSLRTMLREIDAQLVLRTIVPVPQAIERSYGAHRYRTILFTAFGACAALLAAVGLYGVSARAAARRVREIGIRMAVGSAPRGIVQLLVRDAMRGVIAGLLIGVPAALFTARALEEYLFGVSPTAPLAYLSVATLLALTTLAASAWPAWQAARLDPLRALRSS